MVNSFLVRRSNVLYFRLSVPRRFHSFLVREFVVSLKTELHKQAVPRSLLLASEAKKIFLYCDSLLTNEAVSVALDENIKDALKNCIGGKVERKKNLPELIALKKQKIEHDRARDELEDYYQKKLVAARQQAEKAALLRENELLKQIALGGVKSAESSVKPTALNSPTLSEALDAFLESYTGSGSADGGENFKKMQGFCRLFNSYLPSKNLSDVNQVDVNQFFKLLVQYPGGRGGRSAKFEKLSFLERIKYGKANNLPAISAGNFRTGYRLPANQVFSFFRAEYPDFANLSVDHVDYEKLGGKVEKGTEKQRSLRLDEVEKLVKSVSYFLDDDKNDHKFWLVLIGLYSGMRVNEICQLNPQTDILKDKSGNWYLWINDETEADDGIDKRLKTGEGRKVPIHFELLKLGFVDYVERVKKLEHKRIFNAWKPKDGRASYYAEKWFREHLISFKLRDDTLGKKVLGMHCLRSTFSTHLVKCLISDFKRSEPGLVESELRNKAYAAIRPVIGHADGLVDEGGKSLSITAGYVDDDVLADVFDDSKMLKLAELVNKLSYQK